MADAMKINQESPADVVGGCPTQPKVFISYSWTAKDKARNLAERLLADGVDVVMDIYDLNEGMEKYTFMQRIVNDSSIEKNLWGQTPHMVCFTRVLRIRFMPQPPLRATTS